MGYNEFWKLKHFGFLNSQQILVIASRRRCLQTVNRSDKVPVKFQSSYCPKYESMRDPSPRQCRREQTTQASSETGSMCSSPGGAALSPSLCKAGTLPPSPGPLTSSSRRHRDAGFFSPQELLTKPLFPLHLVIALDASSGPGESRPTRRPCRPLPQCFPPRSWLAAPRSPRTPQDSVLVQTEGSGGAKEKVWNGWNVPCL